MSEDQQKTKTGWSNIETWCVSQWLPTDEATWDCFREQLRQLAARRTSASDESGQAVAATRRRQKFQLAKQLRDAVSRLGYMELPLVYCDLLEAALARVNWLEMVEHFLGHPFPKHLRRTVTPHDPLLPLFEPGRVFVGPAAQTALSAEDIKPALSRHMQGDWGLIDAVDRRQNLRALRAKRPVQSVYQSANGTPFWVVTDADRALTSVLLAEDY